MLSVVIALLTMVAMAGGVLRLRQMRRNREVNELLLQLRTRDALLADEVLAALPIALTVHSPRAFWSPALVEITGRVPTADLRDDVVRLVKREVSRWCIGARTAVRLVVDPLIGPRVAAGTRGAASAVTPGGMGPHVLIADDDRPSLNGLEVLLTRWGYRVETATDGQMALEKTLALHPSLVITDFTMPRLNGLEVCEVLRRDCPEIPVIILTGQGAVMPLLPAPEEGPYGYLEKPVEVPQLRMLVAKALAPEPGTVSSRASRGLGRPEVGVEAVGTVGTSARVLVKSAAEVGGDVGLVARNAAATGALKGAGEIGHEAVEQVQRSVTGLIAGVKVVVKEPFK
jgi:CheY-like chemotaxis protein